MCSKLHANPSMLSQGGRSAAGPVGPAAAAAGAGTVAANGLAFVVVADSDGDDGGDAGVCGVKGGRCACAGTRPIRSQDASSFSSMRVWPHDVDSICTDSKLPNACSHAGCVSRRNSLGLDTEGRCRVSELTR